MTRLTSWHAYRAHIESTEGVRVGLEAGVDTIEHGGVLDDELLALFRENARAAKAR